jgi:hypothetical protein
MPPVQQSNNPIAFVVFSSIRTFADSGSSKIIDENSSITDTINIEMKKTTGTSTFT